MQHEESMLSGIARRVIAWVVLIVALVIALKIVGALVFGFLYTLLTIAAVVVLGAAVIWALRRV